MSTSVAGSATPDWRGSGTDCGTVSSAWEAAREPGKAAVGKRSSCGPVPRSSDSCGSPGRWPPSGSSR